MHRRTPTGTRTPDNAPRSLDEVGDWLAICGGAGLGLLLTVTAAQWIAGEIALDRLIAFAIGFVACMVMISVFLGIAAVICSRPPTGTNR